MAKTKGFKVRKDGIIIAHPDIRGDVGGDSIKVPQVDTELGAGFGDTIQDSDRAFAACREPVGHFLTFGVAADMTEKWFTINDPDTEEADPALDRTVQNQLMKLKFKQRLTELIESERIYGKALLVCGFSDAKTIADLKQPLKKGSELLQLAVYPSTLSTGTVNPQKVKEFEVESKDEDPNSTRYGEPLVYKLHRGGGSYLYVHYTRCYELKTRTGGTSVLDPIWDDVTCGRNIRWGASQWMYRTGSGFPVVGFPAGTTVEKLETYADSGAFSNLMSRTGIFIAQNSQAENDGMTFTFEGVQGRAVDPTPFFKTNLEQIAVATGIPQAKLIGAQAGAVTGSEVNVQDYFKVISREQSKIEDCIRWVIDKLADSGQLTLVKAATDTKSDKYHVKMLKRLLRKAIRRDYRHKTAENYVIEWNSAFELSALQEADIELKQVQANQGKLDYMTVDEVRAENQLDPLPNGEGEKLKSASFGIFNKEKQPDGEEEEPFEEGDSYLVTKVKKHKNQSVMLDEGCTTDDGRPGHWITLENGQHICVAGPQEIELSYVNRFGRNVKQKHVIYPSLNPRKYAEQHLASIGGGTFKRVRYVKYEK